MNFRDAYEFDPETDGGLPGLLRRAMQQQGTDLGSNPNVPLENDSVSNDSPQRGLLGRLLALYTEQSQYQPVLENRGQAPSLPPDPNFRQLARVPNGISLPTPGAPGTQAELSTPPTQAGSQADQAQQAREAAAARLVRGVRSATRAEAAPPDPIDIAKSAGIGLANGAVNATGLVGDALMGFGFFPEHFVENPIRRLLGYPDLPANTPGWAESSRPDALRRLVENYTREFYQPKSRAGRYAETIGEMAPLIFGGAAWAARRGGQAAAAALRGLPETLAKHAVLPGIAVEGLEEALPESQVGQTFQKAYPVIRHGLPLALAGKRHLGRRGPSNEN